MRKMKKIMKHTTIIALLISIALGDDQEPISNDSLAVLLSEGQEQILDEVVYEDPLANKKLGIMFNPISPILYEDGLRLSGGFSYFPKDKDTEFSLGYQYINKSDDRDYQLDIDILNRFYFGRKYRKGFHLLYGGRVTSYRNSSINFFGYDIETETTEGFMLGVSFGLGYRILSKKGWYWGASYYIGRHLLVENENDDDIYMWMELLKIGYLFK